MLLSDSQIKELGEQGMISPFVPNQVRMIDDNPIISYGTSSCGYDFRLGNKFRVFQYTGEVIDILNVDPACTYEIEADQIIVPPHGYILGTTVEQVVMPPELLGVCIGKSTLARAGLLLNVTPLEPSWAGYITVEIANLTPNPIKIYANMGIMQVLFFEADDVDVTYDMRDGKYQGQPPFPVLPRI